MMTQEERDLIEVVAAFSARIKDLEEAVVVAQEEATSAYTRGVRDGRMATCGRMGCGICPKCIAWATSLGPGWDT